MFYRCIGVSDGVFNRDFIDSCFAFVLIFWASKALKLGFVAFASMQVLGV